MDSKTGLYSIYDKVAERYGPVFEANNDAVALRAFKRVVKDDAEDYKLVKLGYFDHEFVRLEQEIVTLIGGEE